MKNKNAYFDIQVYPQCVKKPTRLIVVLSFCNYYCRRFLFVCVNVFMSRVCSIEVVCLCIMMYHSYVCMFHSFVSDLFALCQIHLCHFVPVLRVFSCFTCKYGGFECFPSIC